MSWWQHECRYRNKCSKRVMIGGDLKFACPCAAHECLTNDQLVAILNSDEIQGIDKQMLAMELAIKGIINKNTEAK